MKYNFRYSRAVQIITALGILALGLLLYVLISSKEKSMYDIIGWGAACILIFPILSMPISLEDDGDTLVLKRLLWSEQYSRTEYTIEESKEIDLSNSIRIFGSGGYFGFIGLFWKSKIGIFRLIQTEASNSYLIIRKIGTSKTLYISYSV